MAIVAGATPSVGVIVCYVEPNKGVDGCFYREVRLAVDGKAAVLVAELPLELVMRGWLESATGD